MATSTVPAVLDALKTILDARAGIIGPPKVEVYTAGMGDDTAPESITFYGADWTQDYATMPYTSARAKSEEYRINGEILIYKQGGGNTKAKAAYDRAFAILAEIENMLRAPAGVGPTLSNLVPGAHYVSLREGRYRSGIVPGKGRLASITFDLECKYRI